MITKFKIFENNQEYKIGDLVKLTDYAIKTYYIKNRGSFFHKTVRQMLKSGPGSKSLLDPINLKHQIYKITKFRKTHYYTTNINKFGFNWGWTSFKEIRRLTIDEEIELEIKKYNI